MSISVNQEGVAFVEWDAPRSYWSDKAFDVEVDVTSPVGPYKVKLKTKTVKVRVKVGSPIGPYLIRVKKKASI